MAKGSSVTAFLLDRALNLLNGNKRLLARRLQLHDHLEVYRWIKRLAEGGQSATAAEALLRMFARENISVDEVLIEYSAHMDKMNDQADSLVCPCEHDEYAQRVHSLREAMEIEKYKNDHKYSFIGLADNLMTRFEYMFCAKRASGSQCPFCRPGSDECPCGNLSDLIDLVLRTYEGQDVCSIQEYEMDLDDSVD